MATRELIPLRILPTVKHGTSPGDRASVEIYRPFFLAGIFSVLTAGCLLGAIALFGIGMKGSYTASAWTPYVWAHANSQLFGWVGFFVIGFALQQHAPTVAKRAIFHRLAYASLGLMAVGIALRFVAEPMAQMDPKAWVPVGVISCVLQLIAILLFHYNSGVNRHRSGEGLKWPSLFVFASLFWLTLIAAVEPLFFVMTHQSNPTDSIMFVAKWFSPYRETQFLGFVAMMIFGVALVKMNSCFGFAKPDSSLGILGFFMWMLGLCLRIFGWIHFFDSGMNPSASATYRVSSIFLFSGALAIVISLGVFKKSTENIRSLKFIRAAFAWLLIGGALMLFEPIHLSWISAPFSHAYTGGIRHALTVGFISQMIIGVSLHVMAVMNDLDESIQKPLWSAFWLLNLGNLGRVTLEIATDFNPEAFVPMGFTGFIELIGLIIWANAMVRPMLRRGIQQPAHAS